MKNSMLAFLFLIVTTSLFGQKKNRCTIKTGLGDIIIELYPAQAPITVTNFLRYVDAHVYDSGTFFRAVTLFNQPQNLVKIEVIQGGTRDSVRDFDSIPIETTKQTGLQHKNGTISMARKSPGSATSSVFICINDQLSLDYGGKRNPDGQGFAAFGKVIRGMYIVKKIQMLHPDQGQYFKPPVTIISIIRIP